jgi:hypothetical protein
LESGIREGKEKVKTLTEVCYRNLNTSFSHYLVNSQELERIKSRIGRLNFDYDDPTPNSDRRLSLSQRNTALEIAGGADSSMSSFRMKKLGRDS